MVHPREHFRTMENEDRFSPMGPRQTYADSLTLLLELRPGLTAGSVKTILSCVSFLLFSLPKSPMPPTSSSIVDDITRSCKAGLASIAFFYFDFKDEAKKHARGALCSLVQLAAQSDAYSKILSVLYSENHARTKQPTDHELRECLKTMLVLPDQAPIYIVMDALDECPNSTGIPSPRENVLRLVEWLLDLRCSNLWFTVTSRPEADIEAILQPVASQAISLHNETGQMEDITNYIKWFVNSDPKARKWRKQDKELVIEKLSARADGM